MTRVTIDIAPETTGCHLKLTHEGVPPEWFEQTRSGWTAILNALAENM
jgi:hypothetical protein